MFCKSDVRRKSIVPLALSYGIICRKLFCKSGPGLETRFPADRRPTSVENIVILTEDGHVAIAMAFETRPGLVSSYSMTLLESLSRRRRPLRVNGDIVGEMPLCESMEHRGSVDYVASSTV